MNKIAIYGAGSLGQYVYQLLNYSEEYKITCFIDNNKSRGFDSQSNTPIVSLEVFESEWANDCDIVLVAVSDANINQEMVLSLIPWYKGEIKVVDRNVFTGKLNILNEYGKLNKLIRNYKEVKPTLHYVEYDVTTFCNLKCKNCGHKSDLVTEINQGDKEKFQKALLNLKKIFRNIEIFRLMGGEPFIVQDLDWYIEELHKIFPRTEIHIVSNGLLITSVSDKIIDAIRNAGAIIDISQYPPTRMIAEDIINRLNDNDISSCMSAPIQMFMKREKKYVADSSKKETNWQNCISRKCNTLWNGYLMPCGMVYQLTHNNGELLDEINFKENSFFIEDCINNGWEIIKKFNRSFSLCELCSYDVQWEKWERINR